MIQKNKKDTEKAKKPKKLQSSCAPHVTHFPSPIAKQPPRFKTDEEKIDFIAVRFREIMEALGLDLNDASLAKSPKRIAYMYVKEIFSGLDPLQFPNISFVPDHFSDADHPNIVHTKVSFTSFCEHHFVPFEGFAYIAYLPKGKLIGLSKMPRIVRFFSRRPQLQERLTAQIADCLSILLETEDVAVLISANHQCVAARGIEDRHSETSTMVLRGAFKKDPARHKEFFELARHHQAS